MASLKVSVVRLRLTTAFIWALAFTCFLLALVSARNSTIRDRVYLSSSALGYLNEAELENYISGANYAGAHWFLKSYRFSPPDEYGRVTLIADVVIKNTLKVDQVVDAKMISLVNPDGLNVDADRLANSESEKRVLISGNSEVEISLPFKLDRRNANLNKDWAIEIAEGQKEPSYLKVDPASSFFEQNSLKRLEIETIGESYFNVTPINNVSQSLNLGGARASQDYAFYIVSFEVNEGRKGLSGDLLDIDSWKANRLDSQITPYKIESLNSGVEKELHVIFYMTQSDAPFNITYNSPAQSLDFAITTNSSASEV